MKSPKLRMKPHSSEHKLFEEVFDIYLNNFFDLFGLDVIKLGETIGVPEDKSFEAFVIEKTNPETSSYIRSLI